jgi:hypothetical protein
VPNWTEHPEPGGELNNTETAIKGEVGVESPPEFGVEPLRTVNVRDRDDHYLELYVHGLGASATDRVTAGKRTQSCHIFSLFIPYPNRWLDCCIHANFLGEAAANGARH